MRKDKRDYKSKKIMVAVTSEMDIEMENFSKDLGITKAALLRFSFIMLRKMGKINPSDLVTVIK